MHLWQDGIIALLAAIGLIFLLWSAVRLAAGIGCANIRHAVVLFPAKGSGEHLEAEVRSFEQLRKDRRILALPMIVDCGLDDDGRKLAQLLCRSTGAILCDEERALTCLREK